MLFFTTTLRNNNTTIIIHAFQNTLTFASNQLKPSKDFHKEFKTILSLGVLQRNKLYTLSQLSQNFMKRSCGPCLSLLRSLSPVNANACVYTFIIGETTFLLLLFLTTTVETCSPPHFSVIVGF